MNKSLSIILILLLFLLLNLPFVYRDGFWDGDSNRIYAGLVNGFVKQTQLHGPYLHGKHYHFGYFFLIFKLYPLLSLPLKQLPLFMNYLNFTFATVLILFLWLSAVELFNEKIANLVTLIFVMTPTILDLALYAHPYVAGLSMFMVSFYLYVKYLKSRTDIRWIFYIVSFIFVVMSFTLRGTLILALPVLLGTQCVLQKSFEKKYFVCALGFAIASVTVFLILDKLALNTTITTISTELQRTPLFHSKGKVNTTPLRALHLKQYFHSVFRIAVIPHKLFAVISGFGFAHIIVLIWGLSYFFAQKKYRLILFCMSWILIPLGFWWQYRELAPRYYLLIYLGLSFFLANFIVLRFKKSLAVVVFLFLLNFIISVAIYKPVNSLFPGRYVTPKGERILRRSPVGDFVSGRKAKKHQISRLKEQFKQIIAIPADSVLVVGDGLAYIVASIMLWDRNYKWRIVKYGNIRIQRITTSKRTFDLLRPKVRRGENSLNRLTAQGYFRDHTIAIMPQYRLRGAPIEFLPQYKYLILDL